MQSFYGSSKISSSESELSSSDFPSDPSEPSSDFPPDSSDEPSSDFPPDSSDEPSSDFPPDSSDEPSSDFPPDSSDEPSDDNPPGSSDEPSDDNPPGSSDEPSDDNPPGSGGDSDEPSSGSSETSDPDDPEILCYSYVLESCDGAQINAGAKFYLTPSGGDWQPLIGYTIYETPGEGFAGWQFQEILNYTRDAAGTGAGSLSWTQDPPNHPTLIPRQNVPMNGYSATQISFGPEGDGGYAEWVEVVFEYEDSVQNREPLDYRIVALFELHVTPGPCPSVVLPPNPDPIPVPEFELDESESSSL